MQNAVISVQIPIKPLSVNHAWKGQKYKTTDYKQYERILLLMLPPRETVRGEVHLAFEVGLNAKSYPISDVDNFAKPLLDILVKRGYIEDDRKIVELTGKKLRSAEFYVKVWITPL